MGVVYEAEQVSLGRRVALKLLPQALHLDAIRKARFEREAAGRPPGYITPILCRCSALANTTVCPITSCSSFRDAD